MKRLLVLYDDACGVCHDCAQWLAAQPSHVPISLWGCSEQRARDLYGHLPLGQQLVVVGDDGRAWVGPQAFLICLWALVHYRGLSTFLMVEPWTSLSATVFSFLSQHRASLGKLLGTAPCTGQHCGVGARLPTYRDTGLSTRLP